jgi:uncharacterized Zn-finger protein
MPCLPSAAGTAVRAGRHNAGRRDTAPAGRPVLARRRRSGKAIVSRRGRQARLWPFPPRATIVRADCKTTETTAMAGHIIPHFQNSAGHEVIEIGVSEFMCIGALPPFDHPHVYLDLGDEGEKVCGYCSTLYRRNASLHGTETIPAGCLFEERSAA